MIIQIWYDSLEWGWITNFKTKPQFPGGACVCEYAIKRLLKKKKLNKNIRYEFEIKEIKKYKRNLKKT